MFNYQVIWPLFELAAKGTDMKFIADEKELSASEELCSDDAIIEVDSLEICVLETSGKFQLKDKARFGYDHVKDAFAALSMLRKIFKKYCYAKKSTAKQLKIYFVHARADRESFIVKITHGSKRGSEHSDTGELCLEAEDEPVGDDEDTK